MLWRRLLLREPKDLPGRVPRLPWHLPTAVAATVAVSAAAAAPTAAALAPAAAALVAGADRPVELLLNRR